MIKNILLDCDGVLADFVTGVLIMHGRAETHDDIRNWNFYKEWGMSDEKFWEPTKGVGFWDSLPVYPWAEHLYESLSELAKVTIVTSPSDCPYASAGKTKWLKRNFGIKPKNIFIGGRKELMARPDALLIDDYPVNIENFAMAGGLTILFPQPWNGGDGDYVTVLDEAERLIYDY